MAVLSVVSIVGVSVAGAVASGSAVAASAPALDHFECYAAATTTTRALRASFRAKPHTARLKNKFGSNGFTVGLDKVAMQCSPAKQTAQIAGHEVVSPITDAKARLVCWTTAPKRLRLPGSVTLANQFGIGTVAPTAARSLCLASWKNGSKPLAFPSTNAPSNLDTYVCYTAVHLAGQASFSPPSRVTLDDQFANATTRVGAPNIVCLPTSRYVSPHHSWTRIVNPAHDIVCFGLATTTAARTTYDKNAFGTGAVKTTRSSELCVPSTTTTIPPPTTTTTTAPPTTTTVPVPGHWTPSSAAPISWYWQLAGTVNLSEPAQVYDIDGFSASAATVTALHTQGKTVICYINFGAAENFRSDYASFPASVQGLSNGWPGETWLDIRQLAILEPIMTARMQMCVQKGFDGLEPDNIDGYANTTGFPLTPQDQLTYNTWIATEAHALGLSVGLKNDTGQIPQLEPDFDWALNEQCNQTIECGALSAFTNANKAVFNAEYADLGATTSTFCPADAANHINGALLSSALDGTTYQPCTGTW